MLSLSADNLPALIEARMALELGLVTFAAEKISDEQLTELPIVLQLNSLIGISLPLFPRK